jgi:hypothetical protein
MEPLGSAVAARRAPASPGPASAVLRRFKEGIGASGTSGADRLELSTEASKETQKLKALDQKVRAHEAAHQAAGAGLVGGASFTYQRGADGRMYAVGGEVSIDTSPVPGDPEATLTKMQQVQAAALAPADPSAQDRAVAAAAAATAAAAQGEAASVAREKTPEKGGRFDLTV